MKLRVFQSALCVLAVVLCVCQKGEQPRKLVKVGKTIITQKHYEAFDLMRSYYPVYFEGYFPGNRSSVQLIIETQALFEKAKFRPFVTRLRNSDDWKWKEIYYSGTLFFTRKVQNNFGFTEKEIEDAYKAHSSEYLDTIHIAETRDTADTSKIIYPARDSIFVKPLAQVRSDLLAKMFVEKYPPDSSFYASFKSDSSTIDSAKVKREWFNKIKYSRETFQDFFCRTFYKQLYNKQFPDSIDELFGKGKLIDSSDIAVVLQWLPKAQRQTESIESAKRRYGKYLIRWKIFSTIADKVKFRRSSEYRDVIDWALKMNVAVYYVDSVIVPKAKTLPVPIDTQMLIYSYWDNNGYQYAPQLTAPEKFNSEIKDFVERQISLKIDSIIYTMTYKRPELGKKTDNWRQKIKKQNVTFLQNDWLDDRNLHPLLLKHQADSLLDSGKTSEAENLYQKLVDRYPFSTEAKIALSELGKILVEKGSYRSAITNYRKYLLSGIKEKDEQCKAFFMIGFTYDEHMNKSDLAEVNYKWIMKNTPDCELADDAEFMIQHLDEEILSIEELRAEAERQGRKIEPEEDTLSNAATTPDEKNMVSADSLNKS